MASPDYTTVTAKRETRARLGNAKPYEMEWDDFLNELMDVYEEHESEH